MSIILGYAQQRRAYVWVFPTASAAKKLWAFFSDVIVVYSRIAIHPKQAQKDFDLSPSQVNLSIKVLFILILILKHYW